MSKRLLNIILQVLSLLKCCIPRRVNKTGENPICYKCRLCYQKPYKWASNWASVSHYQLVLLLPKFEMLPYIEINELK